MEFPIVAGLVLSLVVLYWPGEAVPPWLRDWLNWLWILLGITFLAGIALSFYGMTSKPLPGGGTVYSASRPQYIQYALVVICVPLMLLTLLGAGYVASSVARGWSPSRVAEVWRTAAAGIQFRKLWASLAVALCALAVGLRFGAPVALSTDDAFTDLWRLAIYAVAAIVFFTALASAWSAVRPSRQRQ
jgi:hypothetical protein